MANQSQVKALCKAPINAMFGLTKEELWNAIEWQNTATGRFYYWCHDNKEEVFAVWNAVEAKGVSPVWFTAYEFAEGYNSSTSWLNHFYWQPPIDAVGDAKLTADWIVETSKRTDLTPAWYDAMYPIHCVPQDVQSAGNAEFASWTGIGKVWGAGTAAAAWAIWYPDALKASVNGVQDYGNPLAHATDLILKWGGDLTSYGGEPSQPSDGNTGSSSLSNVIAGLKNGINSAFDTILKSIDNVLEQLFNDILDLFKRSLSSKNPYETFSNGILTIKEVYRNRLVTVNIDEETLHKIIDKAVESLKKSVNDASNGITDYIANINTQGDSDKDDNLNGGENTGNPSQATEKMNQFFNSMFPEVGKWHGQCYRFSSEYLIYMTGRSIYHGLGGTMLPQKGAGGYASLISTDWDWTGVATSITHEPTQESQIKAGDIFTIAGYQGNWGTGVWGHTGVVHKVEGGFVYYFESNYNSTELLYYQKRTVANFLAGCNALIHFI